MDEMAMVREGNHLVPVDQMSAELLATIPQKTQMLVKATQPRNIKQFRLAWVLAAKVAEACDFLQDQEDSMDYLKMKARHVRYIVDHHNGETTVVPKSIRWAALDQAGFTRIFNRMVHVVITEILPGMDEGALRAEIEKAVGIESPPAPARKSRERRRNKPDTITPVCVIPPHDHETGEVIELQRDGNDTFPPDRDPPPASPEPSTVPPPDAADASAQVPQKLPTTTAEWVKWATTWLAAALVDPEQTDQIVMVRWNNEKNLRNACGVTADDRAPVFQIYSDTLDKMRERRK
jgi:hypothetical protein